MPTPAEWLDPDYRERLRRYAEPLATKPCLSGKWPDGSCLLYALYLDELCENCLEQVD